MSNVLPFKKPGPLPEKVRFDWSRLRAALPRKATLGSVLRVVWMLVRLPLFLVLYWLRLPVVLLCNFVGVPLLFLWLFAWYAFPENLRWFGPLRRPASSPLQCSGLMTSF